jgi:hypothetical protein
MLNLRHQVRRISGDPGPFTAEPALEVIYRDLFLRELARMGEEDRFFPTGGAANYSLLYLILRIGLEFKPASVLDIGAGQSSLLWSMLRRHGLVGSVLTLESDREWAQRIGDQIDHEVQGDRPGAVRRDRLRRAERSAAAFAQRRAQHDGHASR